LISLEYISNCDIFHDYYYYHYHSHYQRIDYKIALMTYSCVHGTSPAYFNGICRPVAFVEGRAKLRSANYEELVEPTQLPCCRTICLEQSTTLA